MKLRLLMVSVTLAVMLSIAGCGCDHEWTEATCTAPKHCVKCGNVEGDIAEHSWCEATCSSAKTCEQCGATDGEALGHTVEVGKCDRCLKLQGIDLIEDVLSLVDSANAYWDLGLEAQTGADVRTYDE